MVESLETMKELEFWINFFLRGLAGLHECLMVILKDSDKILLQKISNLHFDCKLDLANLRALTRVGNRVSLLNRVAHRRLIGLIQTLLA